MADYQRRVRLTLTEAEANALDTAILDMMANIANGWEVPVRETQALDRARVKLIRARSLARARNAEKAARKAGE